MSIVLMTSSQMRELDRQAIDVVGIPGAVLMESAGRACAQVVKGYFSADGEGRVAVFCGKGNNGGDGFVTARHLVSADHDVDVFLLAEPAQIQGDAALNLGILERLGVPVKTLLGEDDLREIDWDEYDVIVDALLGTGLSTEISGLMAEVIEHINAASCPVVAVDIPSGLSADTGQPLGIAVRAQKTVTFAYPKPGQVLYPGAEYTGELVVADIGIPSMLAPLKGEPAWVMEEEDIAPLLGARDPDSHKGTFGHLVVVAGSPDRPGAAGLCCRAAMRAGVGLVTLAGPRAVLERVLNGPVEYMGQTIASFEQLAAFCLGKNALALGPGLGTDPKSQELIKQIISRIRLPMVIDADGLNALAGEPTAFAGSALPRVLTPHPGEMGRLLGISTTEVQQDRIGVARRLAHASQCVVVLKGASTVVTDPCGKALLIPAGNPGMASGGTGDVLTGIIGSLLAQGMDALSAASVGAMVHALAGDEAAAQKGQRALIASDLIESLPDLFSRYEGLDDEDVEDDE